ncbi:propionyl-CoA carboxylase alpha chain, mitochondrial-like [Oscarella lobularis]|uniref:propionyl-CoA carboxylase alpha chain, mitochondrial-like n=1 Tax=Oscarella lobularis TaxID=121494 RepID=UPI00331364DF
MALFGVVAALRRPRLLLVVERETPFRLWRRSKSTNPDRPFEKILVANRGEIACRVMKTCKRMGIKTVAVHSDVDGDALHSRMADERVCIGPAPSAESYLNMDAILEAVQSTGAQAVHPGYGFLSENTLFADKLSKAGVVFIGPGASAIEAMGDKIQSKKIARRASVNMIPGVDAVVQDADHAVRLAEEIGYPVMIKASAGGGGKGMRIAWNEQETREGFHLASQEAKSGFGDDRLLIERYVDQARHIEVQVLADSHGNAIYLNERECSIQRRNQKVIEEAPSTFVDPEMRKAMGQQAIQLAKAVGYVSAGTVEFLVDSQKRFYFLEMNTRLQVEHPITEYITGFDLVEQMIRVAAGQQLRIRQEDVGIDGWAVECRVYSEDPKRFLPSIGRLSTYIEPEKSPHVRVETGIVEGSQISIYYDPLISKLVTHGKDRNEALHRMASALDQYLIKGVKHNVPILRAILTHPRFVSGDITTKFIAEEYPEGFSGIQLTERQEKELIATACLVHIRQQWKAAQIQNIDRDSFQPLLPTEWDLRIVVGDKVYEALVNWDADNDDEILVTALGEELRVFSFSPWSSPLLDVTVSDADVTIQCLERIGHNYKLRHHGTVFDVSVLSVPEAELIHYMPKKSGVDSYQFIKAPMPGKIVEVLVKEGEEVAAGVPVCVIEAMKSQTLLTAECDGKVKKIFIEPGQFVQENENLVELD